MGELTSEKTAPYLILLSIALPVGSGIRVEYSFNKPSRLWSDAGRDPGYANGISRLGWEVAKIRTEMRAENRNSR